MLNYMKYKRNPVIDYPEREWPNKEIEKAPIWCSVDLRDGNQALIEPMVVEEKLLFFNLLVNFRVKNLKLKQILLCIQVPVQVKILHLVHLNI